MKNSIRQMRTLDAYVANESIRGMCSQLNSYVLTKKKFRLWSCSLFFLHCCSFSLCWCRYSISHFLTAAKKVFMLFFFQRNQSPLYFPLALANSFSVIHVSVCRHSFVVLFTLKVRLAMRSLKRVGA